MKTQILFLLLLLSFSGIAKAAFTESKCTYALFHSGDVQVNRQWDIENRVCFISVNPRGHENMRYRSYYFDSGGQFMIFNSYGDGAPSTTTGVRDFFIFPIKEEYPDYSVESNGDVIIKMVSGHQMRLSTIDTKILSLAPGTFTEKTVSKNNQGGIEIRPAGAYWFDAGFKMGGVNFDSGTKKSMIYSTQGTTSCSLANKEFMRYDSEGNFVFNIKATELPQFLAKKCPGLKL